MSAHAAHTSKCKIIGHCSEETHHLPGEIPTFRRQNVENTPEIRMFCLHFHSFQQKDGICIRNSQYSSSYLPAQHAGQQRGSVSGWPELWRDQAEPHSQGSPRPAGVGGARKVGLPSAASEPTGRRWGGLHVNVGSRRTHQRRWRRPARSSRTPRALHSSWARPCRSSSRG